MSDTHEPDEPVDVHPVDDEDLDDGDDERVGEDER